MERFEIELHEHEFFLDRVWTEDGKVIRKNISVHAEYDKALEAKRRLYEEKGAPKEEVCGEVNQLMLRALVYILGTEHTTNGRPLPDDVREMARAAVNRATGAKNEVTTRNGLLYLDGRELGLPEADIVARRYGHAYAEQLVKALRKEPI